MAETEKTLGELDEQLKKLQGAVAKPEEPAVAETAAKAGEEVAAETAAKSVVDKTAARDYVMNTFKKLQKALTETRPNGMVGGSISEYRKGIIGNALEELTSPEFERQLIAIGIPIGIFEVVHDHVKDIQQALGVPVNEARQIVGLAEEKNQNAPKEDSPKLPSYYGTWRESVIKERLNKMMELIQKGAPSYTK